MAARAFEFIASCKIKLVILDSNKNFELWAKMVVGAANAHGYAKH